MLYYMDMDTCLAIIEEETLSYTKVGHKTV